MRYSLQSRDRILVKGYGCLSFAKNMGKKIGKNTIKNVSGKYSQRPLDDTKKSTMDHLKLFQKE